MKKDIKKFLESGVLEKYLMGTCDPETASKVEAFISEHPEVKVEYDKLQDNIEKEAMKLSVAAPSGLKEAIVSCLDDDDNYKIKSQLVRKENNLRFLRLIPWAAALFGIISSISLYNHNHNLKNHNMELHADFNMLEQKFQSQETEMALLEEKLFISGHDKTARIRLAGNQQSPDFKTTAFWNNVAGKVILYVNELGPIDDAHCHQVWGDVNGEMIDLGMLPLKPGPVELKYLKNAESINITIEPKGGSEHPTVSKLISSAQLTEI